MVITKKIVFTLDRKPGLGIEVNEAQIQKFTLN